MLDFLNYEGWGGIDAIVALMGAFVAVLYFFRPDLFERIKMLPQNKWFIYLLIIIPLIFVSFILGRRTNSNDFIEVTRIIEVTREIVKEVSVEVIQTVEVTRIVELEAVNTNETALDDIVQDTPIAVNEATQIEIDKIVLSDNLNDVTMTVQSIEFLPNERMRWYLQFENKSSDVVDLRFDFYDEKTTFLSDENGEIYPMVRDKDITSGFYSQELRQNIKWNYWVEFQSPINDAKEFTFVLESVFCYGCNVVFFPTVSVILTDE